MIMMNKSQSARLLAYRQEWLKVWTCTRSSYEYSYLLALYRCIVQRTETQCARENLILEFSFVFMQRIFSYITVGGCPGVWYKKKFLYHSRGVARGCDIRKIFLYHSRGVARGCDIRNIFLYHSRVVARGCCFCVNPKVYLALFFAAIPRHTPHIHI